jgi:drug/metabolite transporter (DMT)-like permease
VCQWAGLALGFAGVYLVLRDKATAGEASALAWTAIAIAVFGITVGTIYQKRFGGGIDWRPALLIQYTAAAA